MVEDNIKELRQCYDEEATKDYDDGPSRGCCSLMGDMFLLENQLPYPLLMLLMSSSNNHEGLKRSIKIFVDMRGQPRGRLRSVSNGSSKSFRNVEEHRKAGINFRLIQEHITYELCTDFQNDYEVTSYIGFLSSLIDHPDDVKHMRKRGILLNLLGSDEEVAQLLKEMGIDLVPNNAI
ncbi:hypothetical protein ACFX2I_014403 [Malus domestica]